MDPGFCRAFRSLTSVELVEGSSTTSYSSEIACKVAGSMACQEPRRLSNPKLLER